MANISTPCLVVRNAGEPFQFKNVMFAGFAAASAKKDDQQVKVWKRLAITSDESLFHILADNFSQAIENMARKEGIQVDTRRANVILLVIKQDKSANLWIDNVSIALRCALKRPVNAGDAIFEEDIVDINGMSFPDIQFDETDSAFCLFRVEWSFGFVFDVNIDSKLIIENFYRALGTIYRILHYRHIYETITDNTTFDNLIEAGWFPFAEIITTPEFKELLMHCKNGLEYSEIEIKILEKFDDEKLSRILHRWLSKPHFASKEALLKEVIEAFQNKKPIVVLKILLTEIEGLLNEAYRAEHGGRGAKLKELLAFAVASAEKRAGSPDTLLFPSNFSRYLKAHTFANFDPESQTGNANSRHAVGHGAAAPDSYTMLRALQAILTVDQFAFYT